jgi:hypothetical protein
VVLSTVAFVLRTGEMASSAHVAPEQPVPYSYRP